MDIQKEREAFEKYCFDIFLMSPSDGCFEIDDDGFYESLETHRLWKLWQAKSQAVPEWISTSDRMPEEGEAVLFLDKNDTIHDGYLSTDYVDGPYGENGQDFGGDQTLWASNSNGEELLLNKVKYWMHRPSNPSASKSGAKS